MWRRGGGVLSIATPTPLCNSKNNPWPDSSDEIRLTVRVNVKQIQHVFNSKARYWYACKEMSPMYLLRVMDNIGHSCRQNIPNHEHPQRFAKTPSPWQGSITPLINMSGWGEIGFQFLPLIFVILRHFFPKSFQEIYSIKRLFGKVNFVTHAIRRLCNQISGFLLDIMYMNICQWYDNRCYIDDCI